MSFSSEFDDSDNSDRPSRIDGHRNVESREDRIARIRAEIARGDYDTPERFDAAIARMFDALDLSL